MKRAWPFTLLGLLFLAIVARSVPPVRRPAPPAPRIALPPSLPAIPDPPVAVEPPPPAPEEPPVPAPSRRSPVTEALHWLTRVQNPDGSWGDGPVTLGGRPISTIGVTSLALLSLFGAGYSHLSKDEFDENKPVGPMIRKALEWMMNQQAEDGFDQALATLSLNEAYGMTASQIVSEAARKSLDALLQMQGPDGSWGGPEPTAWATRALLSAELNELPVPLPAREASLRYILANPHPANVANLIFLTRDKPAIAPHAATLAQVPPTGDGRDFTDWYHASLSLFQYDGPEGPLWKQWNEPMKNAVLTLQQGDGSWLGGSVSHSVVRAGMAVHALLIHCRYANVFVANR